ncbi:MAG: RdgB/HAM1 family non-canonical purine NTP pyrophosphatase [Spirochaetaceae bacterium]|jgi:XTP/dITP diphosphohydrolase|nr:RdgB/HAM1 family non-canonical purine NTP pyrophosphatase [Spirochaetaceae bacterium]
MNMLLFASGNRHKAREAGAILTPAGIGCEVKVPGDFGLDFDPVEDGETFLDNALIKARALYRLLNERGGLDGVFGGILADDSGLCVDALGGKPGIFSARYGDRDGRKIGAGERNALLLEELRGVENRTARFVCSAVLLFDENRFVTVQETVEGEIAREEQGKGGFGYDPVFLLPECGQTIAELPEREKHRISHRGKAFRTLAPFLADGLADGSAGGLCLDGKPLSAPTA